MLNNIVLHGNLRTAGAPEIGTVQVLSVQWIYGLGGQKAE
jgi:hypothetical protein